MENSYTPVAYEYREIIEDLIAKKSSGKVFFWAGEMKVDEVIGTPIKMEEIDGKGVFVFFDNGAQVRIDRIITFFGKPGAGFDEYDSYANQCLSCQAGVPL
ncbi:MAG TPA: hypothetical protein VFE50_13370 [Cyclobacteriaceae bacterium]|nr:hypothetical protein [Cyclobacteriaceae bacterium]